MINSEVLREILKLFRIKDIVILFLKFARDIICNALIKNFLSERLSIAFDIRLLN